MSLEPILVSREKSIASQGEELLGLPPKLARGFDDYRYCALFVCVGFFL